MDPEADNLRATLEEAFDAAEQEERPAAGTPEPVRAVEEQAAEPARAEEATDRGDGRTARGRFAPKQGAEAPEKPATATTGQAPAPAQPQAADAFAKAPQSWKPGAREAWGNLPPDVRAEVYRREKEAATVLQESSQARDIAGYVNQLHQKYAPALQAEGVNVLQASANLMDLASRLRFGSPVEKAQLAAHIIRSYGVDVQALALALDAPQGAPQQQPQGTYQDPRVDQLIGMLQSAEQRRNETIMASASDEVETFGADKEFFEDVREDMADLLEVAAKRKIDLTLEQAYERACAMHPEIGKVLAARAAASQAGTRQGSTQRAKAAASSVRGTPVQGSTSDSPESLRGAIEAAIEASER